MTKIRVGFNKPLPPHAQRLMDVMGVETYHDPDAPDKCPCGCITNERFISLNTGTWKPGKEPKR